MTTTTEHDLADGCPDDSAAHWRDLYEAVSREAIQQATRASQLLQGQVRHDRDVYAAAKREAWDSVLFNTELYVKGKVTADLYALAHRLERLPEKPRTDDLFFIRSAARDLTAALHAVRVEGPGSELAEVRRLREAIRQQGRALHDQHASQSTRDAGGSCRCPGCALLREVDLAEVAA